MQYVLWIALIAIVCAVVYYLYMACVVYWLMIKGCRALNRWTAKCSRRVAKFQG